MYWLSESDWFDKYYPKAWGNWREEYNYGEYRDQQYPKIVPCTWMNYRSSGYLEKGSKKILRVYRHPVQMYIDSFLVCDEFNKCAFIQPFHAADGSFWSHIFLQDMAALRANNPKIGWGESVCYRMYCFGSDDAAKEKLYCVDEFESALEDINMIKAFGMEYVDEIMDYV